MSEEKRKPALDEQTLAKLLEAAYVLQEHNRELRQLELGSDLKRDAQEAEQKEKAEKAPETPALAAVAAKAVAPKPDPQLRAQDDYTFTLAQIVATQHQIQIRNLDLDNSMALIAERLMDIAHADGAAIGLVAGRKVKYRAVAGSKALPLGTEVASERALCLPVIRNGQVFRCPDVNPEFLVDTEECHRRGIQSLIAVPIFHEGGVAGGIEVFYGAQSGFTDQDVHTCQLMAGLVTEALARDEEVTWKQSLASERAMMLEALEKLKPNLTALVEPGASNKPSAASKAPTAPPTPLPYLCSHCGHSLADGELFCGQCGTPRAGVTKSPAIAPLVSSPQFPPATSGSHPADPILGNPGSTEESLPDSIEEEFPDLFAVPSPTDQKAEPKAPVAETVPQAAIPTPSELSLHPMQEMEIFKDAAEEKQPSEIGIKAGPELSAAETEKKADESEDQLALAKKASPGDWSSAASAREYLEQIANGTQRSALARFWDTHRGDIYLAIAVILVACVVRWGIWSNRPVSATTSPNGAAGTQRKADPQADLSAFDRLLISLGLAEAPEVPEEKGNPSTQVWVDLRTALYYCPGADSYGKTPKGKFMTQRDAQLDSYESAYRKPCN